MKYKIGQRIKKKYPFQLFESYAFDGEPLDCNWGMGCRKVVEGQSQYFPGELFFIADGEGFIDIEVLAVVDMPRKIKQRVLYKFDQILPDGVIRKSSKIYTVTIDVFNRLASNKKSAYFHEYTVEED
jgi:hypothetical protein